MKNTAIIIWCIFLLYFLVNLFIGSHPVAKELPQTTNKEENIKIIKEWEKSPLTKIQNTMIPIWRYNRYIYGLLLMLGLIFTFLARNKTPDNKSFKTAGQKGRPARTPKSGAV